MSHSHVTLMRRIAETDITFRRHNDLWEGRCLICGEPVCFDKQTGEGATIEHILPRSLGGTNDLMNLGIAHVRCKSKKGRHWDPRRRIRTRQDRHDQYVALVRRLLAERERTA